MKSVCSRSIDPSSARIACGCVVSRTWNASLRNVRRSTSGARLDPPMPRSTIASSPSSATPSANSTSSAIRSRMRPGSSSQPSHRASSAPVQTVESRSQIRSISSARSIFASGGGELPTLRAHPLEELVERVGELLHALELERLRDVVVVDADRGELLEQLVRLLDTVQNGVAANLAVILEGDDRLQRHRVHRLRSDQLLDVHHVAVLRILRRSRRPQAALRIRALAGEELPARPRKRLLVVLVRELRVGDRELAAQRESVLRADLLEPPVRL